MSSEPSAPMPISREVPILVLGDINVDCLLVPPPHDDSQSFAKRSMTWQKSAIGGIIGAEAAHGF